LSIRVHNSGNTSLILASHLTGSGLTDSGKFWQTLVDFLLAKKLMGKKMFLFFVAPLPNDFFALHFFALNDFNLDGWIQRRFKLKKDTEWKLFANHWVVSESLRKSSALYFHRANVRFGTLTKPTSKP
jgi:hypothetical protein